MAMSEPSFLEVAASIREVLQQNLSLAQQYIPPQPSNPPPVEQVPIQQRFIDFSQHAHSLKLPSEAAGEVAALMAKQSRKYQEVVEQAHLRLIHDIYSSCDTSTAANLAQHARMARDAIYDRSVNKILDIANQLAADVEPEGAASDGEGLSDSGSSSSEDEDETEDETEGVEEEPEEDENSPMRPGEEVPPLETKYLPIFEALHERGKVLTKPEKTYLVNLTGMTYRQITIWFQNRRRGELKEDMAARINPYAASIHSDDSSELSDDFLEKKLTGIQPSDTTFNIRSWRLASAVAPPDARTPSFPPSPTKVGFTDTTMPRMPSEDSDSDLTDSDDDESPISKGKRGVPSLTTSSATFDSGSDQGPATVVSGPSSQARPDQLNDPLIIAGKKGSPQQLVPISRPMKSLPSARRTSPAPLHPHQQPISQPTTGFNFNFSAPAPAPAPAPAQNSQDRFLSVSIAPSALPQFVTSNERGLTVEMDTTPPRSTITLQAQSTTTTGSGSAPFVSPPSPVLQTGSPQSSSPSPSGHSASSPRPAVKPLARRTGCAPRPRPPPRPTPAVSTSAAPTPSIRSSVVLPPSSNPSLASTTLGALLRPSVPPPNIPPEMEERLTAMAGRMGVGSSVNGARRAGPPGLPSQPQRPMSFSFGSTSLPGLGLSTGVSGATMPGLPPNSEQ
ncbi:homeobox domain protein [Rhizoctonia solani]|uniref:Homeobox domain protein n=1 Tax=Rhizoctonia solani TaxID=456999 RepID=A0A8H8P3T3_9AGAM|nr:homeobox domain protein [Rhizoctonia solani]QRW24620.1 homeobox domain protein [Rhizoctonia solani]